MRRWGQLAGVVLAVLGSVEIAAVAGYAWLVASTPQNVVSTTFYTQNDDLDLGVDGTYTGRRGHRIRYTIHNRYTERAIIAFDAPGAECVQRGHGDTRSLHVFKLGVPAGIYAVGFIVEGPRRPISAGEPYEVVCSFAGGFFDVAYHSLAIQPADPLLARSRLEFLAHAELAMLPEASYPPRDRPLKPVFLSPAR